MRQLLRCHPAATSMHLMSTAGQRRLLAAAMHLTSSLVQFQPLLWLICRQHKQSHQAAQDWHQRGSTTCQVCHLQQLLTMCQNDALHSRTACTVRTYSNAILPLTCVACSVLKEMLAKLQLQEPRATSEQSAKPAVHDPTETLHEPTLQLTGQHGTGHTAADYMTPAGARWAYSKVLLFLCERAKPTDLTV